MDTFLFNSQHNCIHFHEPISHALKLMQMRVEFHHNAVKSVQCEHKHGRNLREHHLDFLMEKSGVNQSVFLIFEATECCQ